MDAERMRKVVSYAYAMIFAGFNGPCLSTGCDNFKQNKIKSPLNGEPHIQYNIQSKKLLKLEHVSSTINILCTHNKIFNNWPFCLLKRE